MTADRSDLYHELRRKHGFFVYEEFFYEFIHNELHIGYVFNLSDDLVFRPELRLAMPAVAEPDMISDSLIRNLVFNLGMVEMLSYWKAACPPKVIIRPAALDAFQLAWWKKLFRNGLGEFFYSNGIVPGNDFVDLEAHHGPLFHRAAHDGGGGGILVPVGGGKDSAVTLELLSGTGRCRPFMVNPWPASMHTARKAGFSDHEMIFMYRTIDPLLLELNSRGYLNGHTPFSAMLAFASAIAAAVHKLDAIALSNESSANEPTIPGTGINHQYSKTLEFENDFRDYMAAYVGTGINYYSYLRPLNELQIAKIFSGFTQHHDTFRSCNPGSKTNTWCGKCPKCLFTCIILSPFLRPDDLNRIFGRDLLDDEELLPILWQLTGFTDEKPFECIGTVDEVNAALKFLVRRDSGAGLPLLLAKYADRMEETGDPLEDMDTLLKAFSAHNIPEGKELDILKGITDGL